MKQSVEKAERTTLSRTGGTTRQRARHGASATARQIITCALLAGSVIGLSTQASASDRRVATERFTEYAPVIDVQPIYQQARRTTQPRRECWMETEKVIVGYEDSVRYDRYPSKSYSSRSSTGSVVAGSVIGGVIGNQLGRSHSRHSRTGATVAGAIIGGAIANETVNRDSRHRHYEPPRRVESRPIYETRQVERCKRSTEANLTQRLQYYNVTYRYKGREFVTQMPRDPGSRIELQISVAPARR